jgi:hypothetical protein
MVDAAQGQAAAPAAETADVCLSHSALRYRAAPPAAAPVARTPAPPVDAAPGRRPNTTPDEHDLRIPW